MSVNDIGLQVVIHSVIFKSVDRTSGQFSSNNNPLVTFSVDLNSKTCGCGKWQYTQCPCTHVAIPYMNVLSTRFLRLSKVVLMSRSKFSSRCRIPVDFSANEALSERLRCLLEYARIVDVVTLLVTIREAVRAFLDMSSIVAKIVIRFVIRRFG